MAALNDNS